uniref:cellulase n=1 Tax=Globodera pallida TaxID=36090 RepID=A0A183C4J8_GLOPA
MIKLLLTILCFILGGFEVGQITAHLGHNSQPAVHHQSPQIQPSSSSFLHQMATNIHTMNNTVLEEDGNKKKETQIQKPSQKILKNAENEKNQNEKSNKKGVGRRKKGSKNTVKHGKKLRSRIGTFLFYVCMVVSIILPQMPSDLMIRLNDQLVPIDQQYYSCQPLGDGGPTQKCELNLGNMNVELKQQNVEFWANLTDGSSKYRKLGEQSISNCTSEYPYIHCNTQIVIKPDQLGQLQQLSMEDTFDAMEPFNERRRLQSYDDIEENQLQPVQLLKGQLASGQLLKGQLASGYLPPGRAPPYGRLAVSGKHLISKSTGNVVKLHGIVLYWSQWEPRFWVPETIKRIKCGCNANVVRASMGTQKSFGGYVANPDREYDKMKTIIEAALGQGIYVIVDWHTGDDLATDEISYAKEFFTKIAKTYGNHANIIYEIWNEPTHQVTWEAVIKPYAETMVDLIRQYDQHNVIIVPAPNWDQDVDLVARNPLTGYSNIAYGLHFYAGTHGEALQEKMKIAYDLGLPMFATEYGIGSTNTDTPVDLEKLEQWYAFLDERSLSYTAWQLDDIGEESSMLTAGVSIDNICNPDFLTTYGKYIYDKLHTQNNGVESCSSITKGNGSSSSSSSPSSSSLSATSFVSVTANIGKKWTGGHNVDLTFTNSGSEPVCSVMFNITFASAAGQAMDSKWNMDRVSGNKYTLATSVKIPAGQTYRSSGFAISDKNGDPSVKVVDAKTC